MRLNFTFPFSGPTNSEFYKLPLLPMVLFSEAGSLRVNGLVDTGASVNVLPHGVGLSLGLIWEQNKAAITLSGNLANFPAQLVTLFARIGDYVPVPLNFAWSQSDNTRLILGHANFFMAFNVCVYRSDGVFEVKPNP